MKRLRVGVLYGGRSGEHEVSLASAAAVFANLDRDRYEPIAIRIEKDGRWLLADRPPSAASAAEVIDQVRSEASRARSGRDVVMPPRPGEDTLLLLQPRAARDGDDDGASTITGLGLDVVFPVLHGPYGEDGTIQGLLELANVAYVGCGVLASAVGMDKALMKVVFRANGMHVTDWAVVRRHDWNASRDGVLAQIGRALPEQLFVKPANLGSSVGISKVHGRDELAPAIELALQFDRKVVVESAVPEAREIECAVLGNDTPEASLPGEIVPSREFYDYEAKYIDSGSRTVIPAELDSTTTAEIQRQARQAFLAIDGAGLARVDFLLNRATGELFVNEINTLPGFTTISMYSKMWAASGVDYPTLVDRLIALARDRHAQKQSLKTSVF
ncbi:MAG TPA: D-alanine--D-alanine ligase family protein [Vicinamibacterales bacterium]|nr:D-alanine--D-alanine ligase family protein [Vicinamibacterales bacterium]